MSRKDQMTLRFVAAMVVSIAIEINLLVLIDSSSRTLATIFLAADLVALVGFVVSFVKEDDREQIAQRELERRRNDPDAID